LYSEEKSNACRIWRGKPEGKGQYEDLDVDGKIILKCGGMDWIYMVQDRG
jgi:hypothetical protein